VRGQFILLVLFATKKNTAQIKQRSRFETPVPNSTNAPHKTAEAVGRFFCPHVVFLPRNAACGAQV